jgi:DNA-binding MarR family transcriptional regulator
MASRPTSDQLHVWRLFLRAHAQVTRSLESDLVAEHDLPLAEYDVLLQLAEGPETGLRMSELARRVLLSRSGITRLVDRLVREGLVRKELCQDDLRGTLAVLTPAGRNRLRRAAVTHLRGIRTRMVELYDDDELDQLGTVLQRLAEAPAD